MIINISLDKIQQNPWQTRVGDPDPEYIKDLALDIAKNGLLQAPVGRLIDPEDGDPTIDPHKLGETWITNATTLGHVVVQLAFGHNRLAAYKLLYIDDVGQDDKAGYDCMPVQIRELTDVQMAEIAWSENEKRRDVTPVERARAIEKRMADFGWSQNEVADHLGLARPTVSNILRLLKLPQHIQDALGRGEISARVASALLPMYELPDETLKLAETFSWYSPTRIVKKALDGASSDDIRGDIERLYETYTRKLQGAEFGLDDLFLENLIVDEGRVYCGVCRTCDRRLKHDGNVCLDMQCFKAKTTLHRRGYLARAAAASGYEVSDPEKGGLVTSLTYGHYRTREILETRCPNLRLTYTVVKPGNELVQVKGFPHAMIICDKRNNSCTCAKGLSLAASAPAPAAVEYDMRLDPENEAFDPDYYCNPEVDLAFHPNGDEDTLPEFDGEVERVAEPVRAQTLPSAKDLEEIARQARKDKIEVGKKIDELKNRVIERLVEALNYDEPGVFWMIHWRYVWPNDKDLEDLQAIYRKIARNLAQYVMPSDPNSVASALEFINKRLATNRLAPISLQKTLVELFQDEEV